MESARRSLIVFLGLLVSLAGLGSFPYAALGALVVFAGLLAAWQPATALLILTTILPVAAWLGRRVSGEIAWAEALVAGIHCRLLREETASPRSSRDRSRKRQSCCARRVVASLVVQLLVDSWRFGSASVQTTLWHTPHRRLSADHWPPASPSMPPCGFSSRSVLFRAVSSLVRSDATLAPMLVKSFVFGAAAAAAINIARLWEGALRLTSPVTVFGRYSLHAAIQRPLRRLERCGS